MKLPARFWVHLLSHLAFVAILAGLAAGWVGTFFEALAGHSGTPTNGSQLGDVGTVFGFCMLALLLLGALTVTGELFGLIRPYGRNAPYRHEARAMHRKVLLIVVALLSWAGLTAAVVIGSLMRSG